MSVLTANARLISIDLLDAIDKAFQPPVIEANTSAEEIKWAAAQRKVYEWIVAKAGAQQNVAPVSQDAELKQVTQSNTTGAVFRYGTSD